MVESAYDDLYGNEDDFASWFEQQEKNDNDENKIVQGYIVRISESDGAVFVDVNEKIESRMDITEIQNPDGTLKFKEHDKIDVVIISSNAERARVSHKKALKYRKIQEKIKLLGEHYKDVVIEAQIIEKNSGGYLLEDDEGVEYFMPKKLSALKEQVKHRGKRLKVCIVAVRKDDTIVVSRKRFFDIDNKNKQDGIQAILESQEPLQGKIKKITTFGMFVDVNGIEGLVHYTEISYKGPVNPSKTYKEGDDILVKAIGYDKEKKRLSFSVKATSEDPWKEIENELEVGDSISVIVSNIESYGAFVDLGNDIEGFLHISEISWDKNIKHPNEYLKVGQEIVVEVIDINMKARRLRVSLKKLIEHPFENFCKTYKEGDVLNGTIATLTDFGAFVKIGEIDGLLHNEDAFWEKNVRCKDCMKEGDSIEVKIIKIDAQKERISLSRKLLLSSPVDIFSQTHHVDDKVKGTIRDIKDFGVFINIEKDVDALIRLEDLAPLNKADLKIGGEIEGVISLIDRENNKIRVSIKRLERKKEKERINTFSSNEKMTLGDIMRTKL